MGCSSSKLDDLPAVALCRERCSFLDEAIQQHFPLWERSFGSKLTVSFSYCALLGSSLVFSSF
ncbi:hypothetical protein E1A91_D06G064200v1 [Gossypium mustelinum]|uniref:DUF630 domain-containing protein n=1 Tax=Gossypium mustelinum TaxID=34275 RepID=A0A5D2UEY3_GOSMU|nr:hypothetical protein E1A91_D06G064200v1 [Gossypium mustelinum]